MVDRFGGNDTVVGVDASHNKIHQVFVVVFVVAPVKEDSHPLVCFGRIVFLGYVSSIWIIEHSSKLGGLLCFLCDSRGVHGRGLVSHGGMSGIEIGMREDEERNERK